MITTSAYEIALRFMGIREIPGKEHNAQIVAFLMVDHSTIPTITDEIPWCSAFVNYVAWIIGLERSKSWAARSWLRIGTPINLSNVEPDCDIIILKRGAGEQPGPEVLSAPGHVGFYAGRDREGRILLLGGNQGDSVSIAAFTTDRILGIRRLGRQ